MLSATATLGLSALGGTTLAAFTLAADAATPSPTSIAPYVGGGAGAIAVAVLAEVTRRLLNGRLIPRETREIEAELSAAVLVAGQREARLMQVVEDMERLLREVRDDMRDLRRGVERSHE